MDGYKIIQGGKLIKTYWDSKTRTYKTKNVTKYSFRHLWDEVALETGVTLEDIFKLVKKNLEIYDLVIGNWCADIVKEAFKNKKKPCGEVTALELYWDLCRSEEDGNTLNGTDFPDFHGLGKILDTSIDLDYCAYAKGTRINYALDLTPASELMGLPVLLRGPVSIYSADIPSAEVLITFDKTCYTLGHILYGIFWELSFHGGPGDQKKFNKKISRALKEVCSKK